MQEAANMAERLAELERQADDAPSDLMLANAERRMLLQEIKRYQMAFEERERERREELRGAELDLGHLTEELERDKQRLVQRVQDQAIVIHQLTLNVQAQQQSGDSSRSYDDRLLTSSKESIYSYERSTSMHRISAGSPVRPRSPPHGIFKRFPREAEESKSGRPSPAQSPPRLFSTAQTKELALENERMLQQLSARMPHRF